MKLLVFAGSTRAASFNRQLARTVVELASPKAQVVTHLELSDFDLPLYNADLEGHARPPAQVQLKEIFAGHDGWIICSPEYNASYPPLLKNVIDWVTSPVKGDPAWGDEFRASRGKVVGMLSASPGALGGLRAQSHLAPLLLNIQCWVAPKNYALGKAGDAFDAGGQLVNDKARQSVEAVIDQVVGAATRLKGL